MKKINFSFEQPTLQGAIIIPNYLPEALPSGTIKEGLQPVKVVVKHFKPKFVI